MFIKRCQEIWLRMMDEPFRLFFPLGIFCALFGAGYWPLKLYEIAFENTPAQWHSFFQIFGFLFAFVLGFLTTAVPRLTQAGSLTSRELLILFSLYLITILSVANGIYLQAIIFAFCQILFLIFILARRFSRRRRNPPESFIFMPFAFVSGLVGLGLMGSFYFNPVVVSSSLFDLGKALAFQGFILFLLIGVGGFLVRSILGFAPPLPTGSGEALLLSKFKKTTLIWHVVAAVFLFSSFFLETYFSRSFGLGVRAVVVTAESLFQIGIFRHSHRQQLTATTLRIAYGLLSLGYWSMAFFSAEYTLGLLHIVLVGGFSLTTFAVATRVILSHCGHSDLLKKQYVPLTLVTSLVVMGMTARVVADFMPDIYGDHLIYAGTAWVSGLLVWTFFILLKALRHTLREKDMKS